MSGLVDAEGRSALPEGMGDVYDMAGEGDGLEVSEALSEQLAALYEEVGLGIDKNMARFKLEIVFHGSRSRKAPTPAMIMAWTNGGFDNGGGDEVVYFCSGQRTDLATGNVKPCNHPLELKYISRHVAVCPECRNAFKPSELTGQVFASLHDYQWARLLLKMFLLLGANADVRMLTLAGDLRTANERASDTKVQGDVLSQVRTVREHWVIYSLKTIIQDTANGADLEKVFLNFLRA